MKIAFILSRFPYPLEKGDKLRAFQHIKALSVEHEIYLFALSDKKVDSDGLELLNRHCREVKVFRLSKFLLLQNIFLSLISKLPLQVGYFFNLRIKNQIQKEINSCNPDLVYCQLIRTALFAEGLKFKKIIDYQDAFVTGTRQRLERAPWILKPLYKREYNLVREFEKKTFDLFDKHFIISERDKEGINHQQNSTIHVVPNGIDTEIYVSDNEFQKEGILFVGNMNYAPNVDAAKFLVHEIMPLVWEDIPDAVLTIAGASPSYEVRKMASDKVIVTGWVNNIRSVYNSALVFVAPMRMGTGLQNKILEAMSMKNVCITTSLGAEPIGAKNEAELIIRDDKYEIADQIIKMLNHPEMAIKIGENGRRFVEKEFSFAKTTEMLLKLVKQ